MQSWRSAAVLFEGGTDGVKALVGAKVRKEVAGIEMTYDAQKQALGTTKYIKARTTGFVANPWKTYVLVAFPSAGDPSNLAKLTLGQFEVVAVTWEDFRSGYSIFV